MIGYDIDKIRDRCASVGIVLHEVKCDFGSMVEVRGYLRDIPITKSGGFRGGKIAVGGMVLSPPSSMFANCGHSWENEENLPESYIINKGATILFWDDDTKTIIKRSKGDKHDKRVAFLTAYFQKQSGLTKNKANKYLDSLVEED